MTATNRRTGINSGTLRQSNMGYLYLTCYRIVWSGRRPVGRRTVDRNDSCDRGRRRSASDRHRKHCADRDLGQEETHDRIRCQPARLVVVLSNAACLPPVCLSAWTENDSAGFVDSKEIK